MGLMGLLFKFAFECFNILAWPLIALGYPLCASIQAIETNSILDTRKLITYWVCFSLILLFEHAFEKLLEWLPYWPYIKLIIIGCLVTPHFDGSFYVYERFVHPRLSMNPRIVFNWLIKVWVLLKQDDILDKAKREAKDMEPEAMENLTAFKVTPMQPDFVLSGMITCAPVAIKEMTEASVVRGEDLSDISPSKKMQMEWTCAACQFRTRSEANLYSHLQGKRHRDACEKLQAKNQLSKNKIPSSVETGRARNKEAGKDLPDKGNSENVTKPIVLCQETVTSEADCISHLQGRQHENVCDGKKAKNQTSHDETPDSVDTGPALENKGTGEQQMRNAPKFLICAVCEEIFSDMQDYTSHLQGKRHAEASEKVKAKDPPLKSNISSPSTETGASSDSSMDKPHSKSTQTSWTCAACKVKKTSKTELISHFYGRRHAEALEKLKAKPNSDSSFEPWTCVICELIVINEKDLITHLEGRRHKNACRELQLPKKTSKAEASSASVDLRSKVEVVVRGNKWWCEICNISCSSEGNLKDHLRGSKHLARTRELSGAAAI